MEITNHGLEWVLVEPPGVERTAQELVLTTEGLVGVLVVLRLDGAEPTTTPSSGDHFPGLTRFSSIVKYPFGRSGESGDNEDAAEPEPAPEP